MARLRVQELQSRDLSDDARCCRRELRRRAGCGCCRHLRRLPQGEPILSTVNHRSGLSQRSPPRPNIQQAVSWEPQGNRREWFLTRESNFEIRDLSLISVCHMGGNVFQAVVEIGLARHAQCPDVPLTTVHAQVPVNDWKAAGLRSARAHPAAKVTAGHKEGQRNIRRSESQKRRAEAIAALVEREKRGKELLDRYVFQHGLSGRSPRTEIFRSGRLRGINIVERDLPGPTGGLMYP